MAGKGGYQRPEDRSPKAPGVGRNSKRTDTQLIATPNVQEGTDLQQGDRQRIRKMQQTKRLGATPPPNVSPTPGPSSSPSPGGSAALPEYLASMPTNRPGEPMTEGLPFGPGGGPEVLQSYQAPTEKEQIARLMSARSGASPRWQAVIESLAEEMRPQEIVPSQVEPGPMETATTEGTELQGLVP